MRPVVETRGLTTQYSVSGPHGSSLLTAVDQVSLSIQPGETLGLVGESGCGKSTLGRTIMRLLKPSDGHVLFEGEDITHLSHRQLQPLRREMQMVFQDPYASLNPRFTIKKILAEPFKIHSVDRSIARQRIGQLLDLVQLPEDALERFPHEFSGGQRQRIAIARALALEPALVVLDEPVSALDVSIQAQILNLLADLKDQLDLAYLFIAHDLSVVGQVSDRVAVMYLGRIVESGTREEVFTNPQHPYTIALLSAVPSHDVSKQRGRGRIVLKGDLPNPLDAPVGCNFRTRCWRATERCRAEDPILRSTEGTSSLAACHYAGPEEPNTDVRATSGTD